MSGVHRLQEVEGLPAADLADDDAVRTKTPSEATTIIPSGRTHGAATARTVRKRVPPRTNASANSALTAIHSVWSKPMKAVNAQCPESDTSAAAANRPTPEGKQVAITAPQAARKTKYSTTDHANTAA